MLFFKESWPPALKLFHPLLRGQGGALPGEYERLLESCDPSGVVNSFYKILGYRFAQPPANGW
ncbi:hypothetical protein CCP3SC1_1190004 [Gammaproteobacteria bacterium]